MSEQPNQKSVDFPPIFISYGHDQHEKFVFRIQEELEKRGYKVWIDKEGIVPGKDWRLKIYEGIEQSRRFLAFLSEKSVTSEYCQTEIRIAVGAPDMILPIFPLKLEKSVKKIPDSISQTQCLDLFAVEDGGETSAKQKLPQSLDLCDIENSDFNEKLNEIVAWIEHGEFLRYREELETLRKRLKPESFQDRLQELITQPFKGREWLFKEIDAWGKEEGSPRIFSIIGGPGFGKSTFAANLRSRFPDKIAAAQFIEWKKNKLNSPKQIIKNLAFQLATRLGQYRLRLLATTESADLDELDEGSFFSKLLSEPLSFENPNQGWILLDALDEATGPDGQNPFVQTLMRNREQLPPWLKIIVTTRPDTAVTEYFKKLGVPLLDTDQKIKDHQREDMLEYLKSELKDQREEVYRLLIDKSQGMFLYLKLVCQDIESNRLSINEIEMLPSGCNNLFIHYFDRQFETRYDLFANILKPVLQLCRAAYERFPLDFLPDALSIDRDKIDQAIEALGTLKVIKEENGEKYFDFVHKSIWDWLENESIKYRIKYQDGLRTLAKYCAEQAEKYQPGQLAKNSKFAYPLKYVVLHHADLPDAEGAVKIWNLLGDPSASLPEKQYDFFGDHTVTLDSLKSAIRFHLDRYGKSNPSDRQTYLLRAARLMVVFSNIKENQLNYQTEIFNENNTLEESLQIMKSLPPDKYFAAGCYLLGKAHSANWDIDELISALESHCDGKVSLVPQGHFLAMGPLRDALPYLSLQQLIRLFRIVKGKKMEMGIHYRPGCEQEAKSILETLHDYNDSDIAEDAWWYFQCSANYPEILKAEGVTSSSTLICVAQSLYAHDKKDEAEGVIDQAVRSLPEDPDLYTIKCLADYFYHTGQKGKSLEFLLAQKTKKCVIDDNHYYISLLFEYGNYDDGSQFLKKYLLDIPFEEDPVEKPSIDRFLDREKTCLQIIEDLNQCRDPRTIYMAGCLALADDRDPDDNDKILDYLAEHCSCLVEAPPDRKMWDCLFCVGGPLCRCFEKLSYRQIIRLLMLDSPRPLPGCPKSFDILGKRIHVSPEKRYVIDRLLFWMEKEDFKDFMLDLFDPVKRRGEMERIGSLDSPRSRKKVSLAICLFCLNLDSEFNEIITEMESTNYFEHLYGSHLWNMYSLLIVSERKDLANRINLSFPEGSFVASEDDFFIIFCKSKAYHSFEHDILGLEEQKEVVTRSIDRLLWPIHQTFALCGQEDKIKPFLHKSGDIFWCPEEEDWNSLYCNLLDKGKNDTAKRLFDAIEGNQRPASMLEHWNVLSQFNRLRLCNPPLPPLREVLDRADQDRMKDSDNLRFFFDNAGRILSPEVPESDQRVFMDFIWNKFKSHIGPDPDTLENLKTAVADNFLTVFCRRPDLLTTEELNQYIAQMSAAAEDSEEECRRNGLLVAARLNIITGDFRQLSAMLEKSRASKMDKVWILLESLTNILEYHDKITQRSRSPVWEIPAGYADLLPILEKYGEGIEISVLLIECFTSLHFYRKQKTAQFLGRGLFKIIVGNIMRMKSDFSKSLLIKFYHSHRILFQRIGEWAAVFMTEEQLADWMTCLPAPGRPYLCYLSYCEDAESLPENWFEKCFGLIEETAFRKEKQLALGRLAGLCIEKGMEKECDAVLMEIAPANLASMSFRGKSGRGEKQDLRPLCRALERNELSFETIAKILHQSVIYDRNDFESLNELAPYLTDDPEFIAAWFSSLAEKMVGELEFWKELAAVCPELGLAELFKPALPVEDILALRKELAEDILTHTGYQKKLAQILTDVSEDDVDRLNDLDKQLDENRITLEEYEKRLRKL